MSEINVTKNGECRTCGSSAAASDRFELELTLDSGKDVRITVEYEDDGTSGIAALAAIARGDYLLKLAAGMGLVPGVELADENEEDF